MALGVNLGEASIPECDHTIEGESKEEVLAKAKEHLEIEHNLSVSDELLDAIALLIAPIKK